MNPQHPGDGTIAAWLARAHPDPAHPRAEWTTNAVAFMPLGRSYDAVRLSTDLVDTALAADPRPASEALEDSLQGAVIHGHNPYYYALIRPLTGWRPGPRAELLSEGTWLGVPRLDLITPPGSHWIVPPRFDGDLCPPATVARLIAAGLARQADTTQGTEGGDRS